MKREVYGIKIPHEDRTRFKEILSTNPLIEQIFGKNWIESSILNCFRNIFNIHPVFWFILRDEEFVAKLIALRESYDRFPSLVNRIKKDRENFGSIYSTIDIFYEYKLKHKQVFFQPRNPDNQKECDIKIIIEGVEYWGEILTINLREEDALLEKLNSNIRFQFNEKNRSNNCVFLQYHLPIKKEIEKPLLNFLLKESAKLIIRKGEEITKEFRSGHELFCTVSFFRKGNRFRKGYHGGFGGPAKFIDDSKRVKNKILDKLDEFQFPLAEDIKRFFIIVLKGFVDIIDVDDALLGEETVVFYRNSGKTKIGRRPSGIIHDAKRYEPFKKIDFIIIKKNNKKFFRINEKNSSNVEFFKANF